MARHGSDYVLRRWHEPKVAWYTANSGLRQVRDTLTRHGIKDQIAVIERTGRYHGAVQRAFVNAGIEVRILHPYTTKQYRQPADPGNKTDGTDLSAIFRAAVNGFGLLEHEPDPICVRLQLLARHRRRLDRRLGSCRAFSRGARVTPSPISY